MKLRYCFSALLLLLLLSPSVSYSQWKQATGYSNVLGTSGFNGFIGFENYMLASANCPFSDPHATFDSLFASTDNGKTWFDFAPNGAMPLATVLVGSNPVIVGGADTTPGVFNTGQIISYSSDLGKTWKSDTVGWPDLSASAVAYATLGSTVYAATAYGIYQQTSPGAKWTPDTVGLTIPVSGKNYVPPVNYIVTSGNTLLACVGIYGVVVSTDAGASWNTADNGLPTIDGSWTAWRLAVSGSTIYALVNPDLSGMTYDIYRSSNTGQNWTKMNSAPEPWNSLIPQIAASGSNVFVTASDSVVAFSTDNGATWAYANEGLPVWDTGSVIGYISAISISGPNVVIGTNVYGIWYRPISDFTKSSVAGSQTNELSLSASVPNPVHTTSTISYCLPEEGYTKITLNDVTGKQLLELVNGVESAGPHTAAFDGASLPAGTYYYQLESGGKRLTQALQLIK